ncbi:MAG: putative transposase, partial [Halioglobus sp.]
MAWDNYKVEHQRFQLINAYIQGAGNMTNLFKRYGVSIVTGYKWLKRFLKYGEEGLKDLPKAPSNPKTIYSDVQIEQVIDLKLKHRTWGPKKIFA